MLRVEWREYYGLSGVHVTYRLGCMIRVEWRACHVSGGVHVPCRVACMLCVEWRVCYVSSGLTGTRGHVLTADPYFWG